MKKSIFTFVIFSYLASISSAQMTAKQIEAFDKKITQEQAHQFKLRKDEMRRQNYMAADFNFPGSALITGPATPVRSCKFAVNPPDKVTNGTIALTFDDGPNPKTTPIVLDVLKAHNVKATFFMLGMKMKGNENLIKRILSEGHHIANHSWDHPNFHLLTLNDAEKQINSTQALIAPLGQSENYFRYPFGNSNCDANDYLKSEDLKIVGWHVDTCDWAYSDGQVTDKENQTCEARDSERKDYPAYVLRQAKESGGGIMLMHDIHMHTAMSLDEILSKLEKQNYRFVELSDKAYFPKLNQ